jgi:hypothetical protein
MTGLRADAIALDCRMVERFADASIAASGRVRFRVAHASETPGQSLKSRKKLDFRGSTLVFHRNLC